MPRRVYTYAPGLGWDLLNLVSSAGSVLIAAAIGLLLVDVARHLRPADRVDVNPWNAGTLEWLPLGNYGARSIPLVTSREPLWDQPGLRGEVERGEHYLPRTATGLRETIVTSPVAARPQYVAILTGPSWAPVLAAVGTAAFFLLLTVKLVIPAMLGGALALASLVRWAWDTDRGSLGERVDAGRGLRLPVYVTGRRSHAWWAMVVLMAVLASIFASLVFSYAYLALVNPDRWPRADAMLPALAWPTGAAAAAIAGGAAMAMASRTIATSGAVVTLTTAAVVLLAASVALELVGQLRAGLAPQRHAYDATVAAFLTVQGSVVAVAAAMGIYTLARAWRGLVDAQRRVTFDNTRLLVYYAVAQGLVALAIVHAAPRLTG
jgi:cytochrome c oxidase subunit I+III